jgi:hypothetical protein
MGATWPRRHSDTARAADFCSIVSCSLRAMAPRPSVESALRDIDFPRELRQASVALSKSRRAS